MSRLRRRVASGERERGFSLVEVTVSMTIFGGLMAIIMAVFIASLNQSKDALARADSTESARIAISQLDAQIRSGSVINDPSRRGQHRCDWGASGVLGQDPHRAGWRRQSACSGA